MLIFHYWLTGDASDHTWLKWYMLMSFVFPWKTHTVTCNKKYTRLTHQQHAFTKFTAIISNRHYYNTLQKPRDAISIHDTILKTHHNFEDTTIMRFALAEYYAKSTVCVFMGSKMWWANWSLFIPPNHAIKNTEPLVSYGVILFSGTVWRNK